MTKIVKLRGSENWIVWKFQSRIALRAMDAYGYVNGSELRPNDPEDDATVEEIAARRLSQREWEKIDGKAQRIIVTSLTEEATLRIMTCETSRNMWNTLVNVYESKNETNIHLLHQKWFTVTKDTADIMAVHISKIQDLAHRLINMGETISDTMIMTKILLTLPSTCNHFCTAWESTATTERTLPNLISILKMEETRMNNQESQFKTTALVLEKEEECGQAMAAKAENSRSKYLNDRKGSDRRQKPGNCNYCDKAGHWEYQCITKLRELSKLYDISKKKRDEAEGGALIADTLLTLMKNESIGQHGSWYLDSGATGHMSGNKSWFSKAGSAKLVRLHSSSR